MKYVLFTTLSLSGRVVKVGMWVAPKPETHGFDILHAGPYSWVGVMQHFGAPSCAKSTNTRLLEGGIGIIICIYSLWSVGTTTVSLRKLNVYYQRVGAALSCSAMDPSFGVITIQATWLIKQPLDCARAFLFCLQGNFCKLHNNFLGSF